jgi:Pyruvate/2-oxoacid:ferredoxin oxidoreductase delta subunit
VTIIYIYVTHLCRRGEFIIPMGDDDASKESTMTNDDFAIHYVCTRQEGRRLADAHDRFWASNCGCREGRGGCARSRTDVCLIFDPAFGGSGSNMHEITRAEVDEIFREAETKLLVTRPYRDPGDRDKTDGICFCCDDCCGYFRNPQEVCDKGAMAEATDMDACTQCGLCADVCHFHARRMENDVLVVIHDNCYGCGLCADVCPVDCIQMVAAG